MTQAWLRSIRSTSQRAVPARAQHRDQFMTTNWQTTTAKRTMRYFTQMAGWRDNFVSARPDRGRG